MRAIYIGCIGTHAHGRQVTSLFCKMTSSCAIASWCIQGLFEAYLKKKKKKKKNKKKKKKTVVSMKNNP